MLLVGVPVRRPVAVLKEAQLGEVGDGEGERVAVGIGGGGLEAVGHADRRGA